MWDLLETYDDTPSAAHRLVEALRAAEEYSRLPGCSLARGTVEGCERAIRTRARAFDFDSAGYAGLEFEGRTYAAGRLQIHRLRQLVRSGPGAVRLWVLDGRNSMTDVGALQASAPPGSLFQVASQFNCLEAPDPCIVPVSHYFFDETQGPRSSISAWPGTLLRHYAAPGEDGIPFVQSESRQLNLLRHLVDPDVAIVSNGYLTRPNILHSAELARRLEDLDSLEVALQDGTEVVLGANWSGPVVPQTRISQAFCSTLAAGFYGEMSPSDLALRSICRQLLRGAYLGTILGANALRQRRAFLTLIGGGVFGNPIELIWECLLWAVDEVRGCLEQDLTVIVNGRTLCQVIPAQQVRAECRRRNGELILARSWGFMVGPSEDE